MTDPEREPPKAIVKDTRQWFDVWLTAVEDSVVDLRRVIEEETGRQP